jgi:hypothetical protein
MFRALLAHLHEALHKQHLVYCVLVMSVGCYQWNSNLGSSELTLHSRNIPKVVCAEPREDDQVIFVTCRGP